MASRRRFGRIRQLPSGRWQARYPAPDGRLISAPNTFRTKTAADQFLSTVETDQQRGKWVDHTLGRGTLDEWAARYLATTTHLKPKTRLGYDSLTRTCILPVLGQMPVGDLRPIHVREWVSGMTARGLSGSRVRQAYLLLSQMMAAAEESGMVGANPCRGISLPRLPEPDPRILTPAQVAAIAHEAAPPYGLLVNLLAYGGLRIGEAFALRRASVDELGQRLIVKESVADVNGHRIIGTTKSHQQRTVTLPATVWAALTAHLAEGVAPTESAFLFPDSLGGALDYTNWIRHVWRPAVKGAGLVAVTPHDLRASCASWVIDAGGSVMDAGERLGHAKGTVTTRHYARAIYGRDAEIAARLERHLSGNESGPETGMIESDRAREGHDVRRGHLRSAP
jgi:integrase